MLDLKRYRTLLPAPRAVFDDLARRKDRARFVTDDAAVSWGQFAAEIRSVASWLRHELGWSAEERAAVFAPNRVEWLSAALGIQAAGGAMVPIYATSTAEQVEYVLAHSDSRVVFVDTMALAERVERVWSRLEALETIVVLDAGADLARWLPSANAAGKVLGWHDVLARGRALDPGDAAFGEALEALELDHVGMMLYTSGTSGPPKGVPLTHRNVAANGRDWFECNGLLLDDDLAGGGEVDLLWLPMSHIFGFGEACLGNALGFTSHLCTAQQVVERLPVVRPTVFMSVPAYWEKLVTLAEADGGDSSEGLARVTGGRLRFCLSGGAGLKREVKERFLSAGLLIIEGYGLTEAAPTLTLNRPEAFRFDSVGKPLPSVALELAPDGEILARGPNVFGGYHKDEAATAGAFTADGWLKTGDLGAWTDDGFLQIVGRKKDILVTAGGKNIAPANIEVRFADDPLVEHVVVYGDGQKYLVAGVWPEWEAVRARLGAAAEDSGAVRALMAERVRAVNAGLARHETIRRFDVMRARLTVESGWLTPTLKVKRQQVEEAFRASFDGLYSGSGVSVEAAR